MRFAGSWANVNMRAEGVGSSTLQRSQDVSSAFAKDTMREAEQLESYVAMSGVWGILCNAVDALVFNRVMLCFGGSLRLKMGPRERLGRQINTGECAQD